MFILDKAERFLIISIAVSWSRNFADAKLTDVRVVSTIRYSCRVVRVHENSFRVSSPFQKYPLKFNHSSKTPEISF